MPSTSHKYLRALALTGVVVTVVLYVTTYFVPCTANVLDGPARWVGIDCRRGVVSFCMVQCPMTKICSSWRSRLWFVDTREYYKPWVCAGHFAGEGKVRFVRVAFPDSVELVAGQIPLWPALVVVCGAYPCLVGLARFIRKRRPGKGFCKCCGYNLRGLPEPRCPECGLRFEGGERTPTS